MFLASSLYHLQPYDTTYKYVFRKLDHIMILLAIAGSYTPVCLVVMHNAVGYVILAIEWIMAIAGILLKAISSKSHAKLSMTIYMVMGWLAIFVIPAIFYLPHDCNPLSNYVKEPIVGISSFDWFFFIS